ncbi:hypothetical protein [Caballeronia sp. LZ032]|nr:hypothetical protein [Caballeronia sp. LZ032]MDR5884203.1 hypothetical protein [Caballeronia sp. LZ032]
MIAMTVVLLLLGAAPVVYLNGQNGEDSRLRKKRERELSDTRKDA